MVISDKTIIDDPGSSNDNLSDIGELLFSCSSTHSCSLIRLGGGQEYKTTRFFSKVGRKNDLGFTVPDSVEYNLKWRLGDKTL